MAEFPENAPTLDPTGAPKCQPPLWKRVRAWAIIVLVYAVILGMAAAAVQPLRSVFRPGTALDERLMHLLWAASLLAPLGFVARYFVRMRLKTGRWRGTPEQRQQDRQQRLARCATRNGKRVCAANQTSPLTYAVKWASCSAFDPTCTPWQRTAAWLVLAGYTVVLLAMAAFGVVSFGAACDNGNTITATLLMLAIGVAALLWPGVVAWRLVRGIGAGKVGTTREELDEFRAQRSEWRMRESQKPLRTKLLSAAFVVVVYGLWWMRVTVHHAQHPHESWVSPAMYAPFAIYGIWAQFRAPKSNPPRGSDTASSSQA
jgi:hypothetical protein